MKRLLVLTVSAALMAAGTARADQPDRRTDIHHTDGTTTTVTTDRSGTMAVTRGHGSGQFGRAILHDDIVKDYTRPGSQVERR
jgi:hypothetical protein